MHASAAVVRATTLRFGSVRESVHDLARRFAEHGLLTYASAIAVAGAGLILGAFVVVSLVGAQLDDLAREESAAEETPAEERLAA